jgi:hypothetical protein
MCNLVSHTEGVTEDGVFQCRVLKKIFWFTTGETNEEGRRLHSRDLHELHSSPILIWVIKPRRMIQAGYVKRMRGSRYGYRVLGRNRRERDHLKDMGVEGITILK